MISLIICAKHTLLPAPVHIGQSCCTLQVMGSSVLLASLTLALLTVTCQTEQEALLRILEMKQAQAVSLVKSAALCWYSKTVLLVRLEQTLWTE